MTIDQADPTRIANGLTPGLVRHTTAKSILSKTSGFLVEAGFTHSLNPARNCLFGCTYCYVPTMRVQAGLQPDDWRRWGEFTTFKENAATLLARQVRPEQIIYCSPLVDPYQPGEESERLMRGILEALIDRPPRVFVVQTRGPLVLRDRDLLVALARRTRVRISFSITTNREAVRRLYEPHCAPIPERLDVIRQLRSAGLDVYATLAPLLPCDPEELARRALEATEGDIIGDPLHVRAVKKRGATTRDAAWKVSLHNGFSDWHEPAQQVKVVGEIRRVVRAAGRDLWVGPRGFGRLAECRRTQAVGSRRALRGVSFP